MSSSTPATVLLVNIKHRWKEPFSWEVTLSIILSLSLGRVVHTFPLMFSVHMRIWRGTHRVGGNQMSILSTKVFQKSLETEFTIAICHQLGDKWQSKTLFLVIFYLRLSSFKSVFYCREGGTETWWYHGWFLYWECSWGPRKILVIVSFHEKKFDNQQYSAKLFWQMMVNRKTAAIQQKISNHFFFTLLWKNLAD